MLISAAALSYSFCSFAIYKSFSLYDDEFNRDVNERGCRALFYRALFFGVKQVLRCFLRFCFNLMMFSPRLDSSSEIDEDCYEML